MKNVMILFNQSSGDDEGKDLAEKFVSFAKEKGSSANFFLQETGPDVDGKQTVQKAKEKEIDTLIFIGGDGTISHLVADFQDELDHLKVGLLPGGTVNNFGRALEIPADFEEAAAVILDGHTRNVDYGRMGEQVIISTMTIGILADTAARITQKEKQKYGKRIFIKNFFKLLIKKKKYRLAISSKEKNWQGKTQLVAVTMTNSVGGFTNFDVQAAPDDGLFHVIIVPRLNSFRLALNLPKVILGKLNELPDTEYFTAEKLKIENLGKEKIGTRVDGDPSDDLPVELTIEKGKLTVFVSEDSSN